MKQILLYDKDINYFLDNKSGIFALDNKSGIFALIEIINKIYEKIKENENLTTDEEKALLSLIHISFQIIKKIIEEINKEQNWSYFNFHIELSDKRKLIEELLDSFEKDGKKDSSSDSNSDLLRHYSIKKYRVKLEEIFNKIGLNDKRIVTYFFDKFNIYLIEECKKDKNIRNTLEMRSTYEKHEIGLIITDNISISPILDFYSYRRTISKIIQGSFPNFTIGIYGEWGTGKTTLMNYIKEELKDNQNIKLVWFDAWKYENEKKFALIPLLKTINFSLEEDYKYKDLKKALREAAIFSLEVSSEIISSTVTSFSGGILGGLSKNIIAGGTSRLISKLNEVDKNGIFYNGIENIQTNINKIRKNNPDFRFVVFIDDLDRCSEEKVLEILASIKIFLSLNGIIYILGISHDKVVDLINKKYQTNNGEQYLRKFIQIPITLTEWNRSDISSLINYLLHYNIDEDYKSIILENKEVIVSAIEENPRETKRFLNNLIISYEVFVDIHQIQDNKERKKKFLKELLLVQILKSNWRDVYRYLINSDGKIFEYLPSPDTLNSTSDPTGSTSDPTGSTSDPTGSTSDTLDSIKINKIINIIITKSELKKDLEFLKLIEKYRSNIKLWNFIYTHKITLKSIDWKMFRRVTEFVDEQTKQIKDAYTLLKNEDIVEFNILRREGKFSVPHLSNKDLSRKNLSYIDLSGANMVKINLSGANLSYANLSGTDLSGANLSYANLSHSNLSGANIPYADLSYANLSSANITRGFFSNVILSHANLSKADLFHIDLSNAIIKETNLSNANLVKADLSGTDLSYSNLTDAHLPFVILNSTDLSGTNLSYTIIVKPISFDNLKITKETKLNYAMIDDPKLKKHIKNISNDIKNKPIDMNKHEFKKQLVERGVNEVRIKYLLDNSNFED